MRNLLLFLAVAALTSFGLHRLLPPVGVHQVDFKLAAFAERKDECNVLVVGTSQTMYGVDPTVFDARMQEHGFETHSFNLGIQDAGLAEAYVHLRRIAELEPAKLRWLLVEAESIMRVGDDGDLLTPKILRMMDPATVALLWPYYGEVEPRLDRLARARWRAVIGCVYHVLGVNRCSHWIERALGMGPTDADRALDIGPRGDGYARMEDLDRVSIAERPQKYATKKRHMLRRVLEITQTEGDTPASPTARPFYERIQELAREMGVELVFFTIRRGVHASDALPLAREGAIEALIRFDDPHHFPELYDVDMTFDGGHFTAEGARIFTRYLADAFAEHLQAGAK